MLERQLTKVAGALNQNLNSAQNTALLTFVAHKPIVLHRFGVMANAAAGILSPMRLKLRLTPVATGTAADISGVGNLNPGAARARGVGVYKTVGDDVTVQAGDTITLCVETAAGGTSTGDVWLEYAELPFSGTPIAPYVASA